jgi:hypothetical protein
VSYPIGNKTPTATRGASERSPSFLSPGGTLRGAVAPGGGGGGAGGGGGRPRLSRWVAGARGAGAGGGRSGAAGRGQGAGEEGGEKGGGRREEEGERERGGRREQGVSYPIGNKTPTAAQGASEHSPSFLSPGGTLCGAVAPGGAGRVPAMEMAKPSSRIVCMVPRRVAWRAARPPRTRAGQHQALTRAGTERMSEQIETQSAFLSAFSATCCPPHSHAPFSRAAQATVKAANFPSQ